MISAWTLYWIIKLDAIANMCVFFAISSICTIVVLFLGVNIYWESKLEDSGNKEREEVQKNANAAIANMLYKCKWLAAMFVSFMMLNFMLPSTKEFAAIVVLPKIVNSEFVNQTLPKEMTDIYAIAKDWLKEKAGTSVKETVSTPSKRKDSKSE